MRTQREQTMSELGTIRQQCLPILIEIKLQFIETIFQYIMGEKLKDKDLIKLVNKIFNVLC